MVSTFPPLKLSAVPSSTFVQQEVYVPLRTHSTLFGLIWTFCVSKWGTSRVPDTFFDQDSFPVQSGLSSEVQNTYMTQTLCRDISVVTEFTERRTVCLWPSMSIFDSFIFRNNCLSLSWVEGTNTEDRVMKANHKISVWCSGAWINPPNDNLSFWSFRLPLQKCATFWIKTGFGPVTHWVHCKFNTERLRTERMKKEWARGWVENTRNDIWSNTSLLLSVYSWLRTRAPKQAEPWNQTRGAIRQLGAPLLFSWD